MDYRMSTFYFMNMRLLYLSQLFLTNITITFLHIIVALQYYINHIIFVTNNFFVSELAFNYFSKH